MQPRLQPPQAPQRGKRQAPAPILHGGPRPVPVIAAGRAPSLEKAKAPVDHVAARHRLAAVAARWVAALWWGVLLGTLLGLGRVPWPEALAWSCVSALVLWRTIVASLRGSLDYLLEETRIELGMRAPQDRRPAMVSAMARRGYQRHRHQIHLDIFRPRWMMSLLPRVRITWAGPGAVVEGPRILVRTIARIAVG